MSHLRSRSKALAGHLYEACCSTEEDRARIASTGQLVPSGSLKFKAVRSRLLWVKDLPAGRFFTKRRVYDAIVQIFLEHDIQLPSVPGFSQAKWLDEQASSLTKILQRARKSTAMDPSLADTQAWDCEDRFFVLCEFGFVIGYSIASIPLTPPCFPQEAAAVGTKPASKARWAVLCMSHHVA